MFTDNKQYPPHVQAGTVDCGAIGASGSADVALTWPAPFADTNYTVVTDIVEVGGPTANNSAKRQMLTKTAAGITVRVAAGTVGYSAGALFLHAIAVHD
jgi:hypothetical protein